MHKKLVMVSVIAASVAAMGNSAWADTYGVFEFEDSHTLNLIVPVNQTLTYEHNLLAAVPSVDVSDPLVSLIDAKLELVFQNTSYWFTPDGVCWSSAANTAQVVLDDGEVWYSGPAGSGISDFVDIDLLTDGRLIVKVTNTTELLGRYQQDTSLTWVSSTLSGHFEVVPVPGAVLLGMLGLSAAGSRLRRFV